MKIDEILEYLNVLLDYENVEDPYTTNGLQVEGEQEVNNIAFSVDATTETIQKAIEQNCDMLICHHGIFWPSLTSITGPNRKRIKLLLENDLSLVGMHLPLDQHSEIGNNIELLRLLEATNIKKVGDISYMGEIEETEMDKIKGIIDEKLSTDSRMFSFSNDKIKNIAVCSGGGSSEFYKLPKDNLDLFITGELRYDIIDYAKEYNINLLVAGHYATETLGVKALMDKMSEELPVKTFFIDAKIDF